MKSVIVKLAIQFDIFGEGNDMQKVQDTLATINTELQGLNLTSSPQLFVNMVDDSDVEIADEEFEEEFEIDPTDVYVPIWKEIRDNFEEEGIRHIDAWTSEDENDEDGHTIAKINMENGEVEYLDERAKTDANAQETIQFWVDEINND